MKIPFLGGHGAGESLNANAQDTVNLFLEPAYNGKAALIGMPGLRKVASVPNVPVTFADDYTNLLAFADPYDEEGDGIAFAMTTNVADTATSSQTISGTLSGLSADAAEDLYYDDFDILIGVFTDKFIYKDSIAVTSAAASSSQSWSKSVDFGSDAGVKVAYLAKIGSAHSPSGITATTFTLVGNFSDRYFFGKYAFLQNHPVLSDAWYTVQSYAYDAGLTRTDVVVDEEITDSTLGGTLHDTDVRGVAWYNRSVVRSLNAPRSLSEIASGSIEDGRIYEVVVGGATATYSGTAYGEDETAGPFFYGSTTTTYTASGSPLVLDRTGRDLFNLQGYKTRVEDQAAALVSACANNQSGDADDFALKLLAMQYPLAGSGEHSGNTGWFAWQYHTLGYADLSGNAKVTAPHAYFRTGPACMAGMALAFYCEKYPAGTSATAAKAAIKALLDHLCDNYLITEADHKQRWMFRGGKGRYVLESSTRVFDSAYLVKWASVEHNLWAWWLLKKAIALSQTTASSVLTGLSLDYDDLYTRLENRLYNETSVEPATGGYGLWNALKKRPVNSVWGVEIVEIDQSTKTLTVNGYLNGLLLAGQTLSVEGNASNDATYTVVSATNNSTVISNGSIVAGQYYVVLSGRILYNGAVYFGGTTKQAVLQGVTGVASYTSYGDALVTVYQTSIVVEESITADQSAVYDGTLGNIHFEEYAAALAPIWLYMTFADEYGYNSRAKEAQEALASFRVEDATYSEVTGYRPYLHYITDSYLDGVEYFSGNYVMPWTSYGWPGTEDRVSFEQSFGVVLAQAAVNDYGAYDRDWTALYAGYDLVDGGWAHDLGEYSSLNARGLPLAIFYPPYPEYRIESYAACGATAWACIAQKPNGFLGAANTALTLENRSYKNEVRGLRVMGDYLYAVCGNVCVRFDTSWNYEVVCTSVLNTDSGPVTMADNGYQLRIDDGTDEAYCYDAEEGSWTKLTEGNHDFIGGGSVTYHSRVFLSHQGSAFYSSFPYSEPSDQTYGTEGYLGGLEYDATDKYVVRTRPGDIVRIIAADDYVYAFKGDSYEIHSNNGSAGEYEKVPQGFQPEGLSAKNSVVYLNESLIWLDDDRLIRRGAGGQNVIISHDGMASQLARYERVDDAVAFGYVDRKKSFYQINFPTAEETWVWEMSTNLWCRRASWRENLDLPGRHRANCHAYFDGQNIVGDYENGRLYCLDPDTHTDDGHPIIRDRICPTVQDEKSRNRFIVNRLEIVMETGVGNASGDGVNPQAMLRWSNDNGHTWSNELWRSFGLMGQYGTRVFWTRLGQGRNKTWWLRVSSATKVVIIDCFVEWEDGDS